MLPQNLQILNIANPAAGAEIILTVPAGQAFNVRSMRFRLVTSATAGTRTVTLLYDDGTNIYAQIDPVMDHAASLTTDYTFTLDIGYKQASGNRPVCNNSLPNLYLLAGHRLRTLTTNLAAGDQFSLVYLQLQRYLI